VRLIGFAFRDAAGPVREGYLPLGELTAVIGANDAGKSRLVRLFASALNGEASPDRTRCVFFAQVSEPEVNTLFDRITKWRTGIDHGGLLAAFDIGSAVRQSVEKLYDAAKTPGWKLVYAALGQSRTFSFELAPQSESAKWRLCWCLPPLSVLGPELREALSAFRAHTTPNRVFELASMSLSDRWPIERPDHAGPCPVVELGVVPLWVLPRPVFVPTTDDVIRSTAADTITGLVRQLAWHDTESDALARLAFGSVDADEIDGLIDHLYASLDQLTVPDAFSGSWLTQLDAVTIRVKDEVSGACGHIAEVATRVAPAVLRERYRFQVEASPWPALPAGAPVEVRLLSIDGYREADAISSFVTQDLAEGHRVWVQLSLLQAVDEIRRLAAAASPGQEPRRVAASSTPARRGASRVREPAAGGAGRAGPPTRLSLPLATRA
jgi:hypothetical protein